MKCDGSPDPTILPEINMYMSLWREDVENIDFETVLKESALVLKVSRYCACYFKYSFDVMKFQSFGVAVYMLNSSYLVLLY